jgi:hypothetical protein
MANDQFYLDLVKKVRATLTIEMVKVVFLTTGDMGHSGPDLFGLALVQVPAEPRVQGKKISTVVPKMNADRTIREFKIDTDWAYSRTLGSRPELEQIRLEFCAIKGLLEKLFMGKHVDEYYKLKGIKVPMSRFDEMEDIL